jgi:Transposase IS66 family
MTMPKLSDFPESQQTPLVQYLAQLVQTLITENQALKERVDVLTNSVAVLKEENQQLKDEIAYLKGQKPRPKIQPSALEGPKSKGKETKPRLPRGKHPRKKKKTVLEIHQEQIIQPSCIPEGAIFKGFKTYDVQDIIFKPNNTRFMIARWQLPDGTYVCGKLPKGIHGHYGSELIAYILNDYYACRITEPLLLDKLHQQGVLISEGQLNNILIRGKDSFHQEKDELQPAGIKAHNQIQTDDCGARHKGKNQYTNVIGNEWFTVFTTTDSKSRANFFRLLQGGKHEYLINDDAIAYLKGLGTQNFLSSYIALSKGAKFTTLNEWHNFLTSRNITQETFVRLATEAALFASAIENGIPRDLGVHGDDAGQFDAFIRSLCWIHEERHYRKIVPASEQARVDLEQVRDTLWTIYRDLKEYQQKPNDTDKQIIEQQFDNLFLRMETSSATLNKRLRMTHGKKQELLRVFERPDTPLHNNCSETDARSAVTKRKVSGGTRSDEGKLARDTFLSLKQTCRKLGINFISFLKDRVREVFEIPRLSEIIRQRSERARAPS